MAAFAPDVITQIGPLPITNTLIHTIAIDVVLISAAIYSSKNISKIPRGFQSIVEPMIEAMYTLTESIASGKKAASKIFPYIMTFFIFILVGNFMGLLPGVGTIGFFENNTKHSKIVNEATASKQTEVKILEVDNQNYQITESKSETNKLNYEQKNEHKAITPLFRGATSDINVTLALALISVAATHLLSIQLTGTKDYLSRYLSFNPVNLYVGILELVAEFTKIISLSFRLFGNIYAGEVALHTISNLAAFLAPLPFLLLESIVSIVQALVFSVLTLVFMAVLTKPHHAHEETGH